MDLKNQRRASVTLRSGLDSEPTRGESALTALCGAAFKNTGKIYPPHQMGGFCYCRSNDSEVSLKASMKWNRYACLYRLKCLGAYQWQKL